MSKTSLESKPRQSSVKPRIHIWLYNHPFCGISDQLDFFLAALRQHGYRVSVGRQPSVDSLNVVIENFSRLTRDTLIEFCKTTGKRIAIIMTEHLDFLNGEIMIHGSPLWGVNDYMDPVIQVARIRNLIDCLPYIRCFFVLGDLPELRNITKMLPGVSVRSIPFPKIDFASHRLSTSTVAFDFLFTGVVTEFRAKILALLREAGFSVNCPQRFVSRNRRNFLNRSAKIVLNIPQREDWRWLSSMRIIAALRQGRATISLGTNDSSMISASCHQIDVRSEKWIEILKEKLENWDSLYVSTLKCYVGMANSFELEKKFPQDVFDCWSITDRL